MASELTEIIHQLGMPLGGLLESVSGFRIGSPDFGFVLTKRDEGNRTTHVSHEHSLKVESQVRVVGSTLVISRTLENTGTRPSAPADLIEPLRLVFRQPLEKWRHMYANGGTTEADYPPVAYRTHEWVGSELTQEEARLGLTIESHPGRRSSQLHLPFLVSLITDSESGPGLYCALEWSGSWYMRFEAEPDERSSLSAGVKVEGLRLEPAEVLPLPDVHLGFFTGGLDAGTNSLRRYLYERVCSKYRGEPVAPRVSYDHYFGIGNHFNEELLRAEAKRAAALGVEVFVVDAGWFPGDFPDGVGNWHTTDPQKLPNGLEPVADHVRELGMEMGLWFEPERATTGTAFLKEHPEWFVQCELSGRDNSYHLNLAIREAQDYVIELVGGWITRLDLRWSRWDYNIMPAPFWEAVDPTLKIQFGYLQGLYRVLDTLMKEHPAWMVEQCAAGGKRIDLGTMRRAHTYWFSDQTKDPRMCRYMQARANRFLPGHLLNSSVAVERGNGDAGFSDTSIISRMLGKLSFDGDIASWSEEFTARAALWVAEFKAIRHLLVQDFYQLLPIPTTSDDWDAVQFVSYDGDDAALFVFAGQRGGRVTLPLRGLRRQAGYGVSLRLDGVPRRTSGSDLMERGLSVQLGPDEGCLWRITAEST